MPLRSLTGQHHPKPRTADERLPARSGAAVTKQHLDSLFDERLGAGIFLRRDDAELPRDFRRNVGADVAAALAAGAPTWAKCAATYTG